MATPHPDAEQSLPPGIALAWGSAPVGRRGRKPGHSLDAIVAAAVELADAHGIDGISLPKVAARLGLTANALYRYIASKEELLVLARDAGWGRPPPIEHPDWRSGAQAWTRAVLGGYRGRPWLLDIPIRGGPATPNLAAWLEALLRALAGTGLSHAQTLGCAVLLDGFARSTAMLARNLPADGAAAQAEAMAAFLEPRLRERGLPLLAGIIAARDYAGTADDTIDFGLTRILDGMEILIGSAGAP
jgi:AcrR family transcriptional regulator